MIIENGRYIGHSMFIMVLEYKLVTLIPGSTGLYKWLVVYLLLFYILNTSLHRTESQLQ